MRDELDKLIHWSVEACAQCGKLLDDLDDWIEEAGEVFCSEQCRDEAIEQE
ncbi:MAG TPA: hypothetical protein G4O03_08225 [Dehalococcoidia bacterium]|jgi:predicted nucleic acid-binding Zn ribbon protein|nr:hypothetical protein [Dehalococcoidia bacterium]